MIKLKPFDSNEVKVAFGFVSILIVAIIANALYSCFVNEKILSFAGIIFIFIIAAIVFFYTRCYYSNKNSSKSVIINKNSGFIEKPQTIIKSSYEGITKNHNKTKDSLIIDIIKMKHDAEEIIPEIKSEIYGSIELLSNSTSEGEVTTINNILQNQLCQLAEAESDVKFYSKLIHDFQNKKRKL